MTHPARPRAALLLGGWLCLSSALTGCGTELVKQQQAQDDLAAALQQAQIGKLPEARRWVDRAVAAAPRDLHTYLTASGAESDSEDDPAPLGIVDAGDGERGVFTSVGDDADVVTYMAQAAAKFPDNPLPLQLQEQAQGRLGDGAGQRATAARLAALLEAQKSKPGHALGADQINQLAQAYWDAGEAAKGAADFRSVIATYPRDPQTMFAYNNLAYGYAVADDKVHLPEALGLAKTAVSLAQKAALPDQVKDSVVGGNQDTLGWVQYRLGDYNNALVNVQKGVNSNPRSAESRYHLGLVYKALKDPNSARIELGYAVKLSPGYVAAQRELAALPAS